MTAAAVGHFQSGRPDANEGSDEMQSGSDPGTVRQPDIRDQIEALQETFPRHKFVLVGEHSIQVTRQDDTSRVPHWLLISSDPEKIRAGLRQDS